MTIGGLIILLMAPLDALDGTMARLSGQSSKWGAFTDSVTDRWSEIFIFMGLLYYYLGQGNRLLCLLVFAAAAGSLMVSYTKSRAETLGFDCNVGVLTRMERFLVLAPGLVLNLPWLAVSVIAVLGNFTALQRAWYVRGQAKGK
jgi:CDP-diacylglycerol--glycerol-3-phosphate 3-phosphatidyltransferase